MKEQVTHISIYQSSKVLALINFVFTSLVFIPFAFGAYVMSGEISSLALLLMPVAYLICSFVAMALMFWIYNLVAASFGGIEYTVVDKSLERKD